MIHHARLPSCITLPIPHMSGSHLRTWLWSSYIHHPAQRLLVYRRGMTPSSKCRLHCNSFIRHIPVACPRFSAFRQSTLDDIHRATSPMMESFLPTHQQFPIDAITHFLDDESNLSWVDICTWYFSHLPKIAKDFPFLPLQLVRSSSQSWHAYFVHLASRTLALVQRSSSL